MQSSQFPPWWEPPQPRWRRGWVVVGVVMVAVAVVIGVVGFLSFNRGLDEQTRRSQAASMCDLIESFRGTITHDQRTKCDEAASAGKVAAVMGTVGMVGGALLAVGGAVTIRRAAPRPAF